MLAEVLIYRTRFCPYCTRAVELLRRKGASFREVDVTNDPEQRDRLLEQTGWRTVPQIFINGAFVGGCDELVALDRRGGLEPLLRESPSSAAQVP